MDEARFVFEFVDRGGNPRAPGGGSSQPGGQGSDTAGKYWDAQNAAGGAGGLAHENAAKFGRNHPGVPTPATVPGAQASKPSDTARLSDTVNEIGGIVGQASGALKGLPTGPSDLIGRGKALAEAATRATSLADRMFTAAKGAGTAATAANNAGIVTAEVVETGAAARAAGVAAGVARTGAASVGGTGAAGAAGLMSTAAGPVAIFAALAAAIPTALAAATRAGGQYAQSVQPAVATFSPEAARATANAEITQLLADMRSARRLGGEIAVGIEARAELGANVQSLKDKAFAPFIELGNDLTLVAEYLTRKLDQATDEDSAAVKASRAIFDFYTGGMIRQYIREAIIESRDKDKEISYFDWFAAQPHIAPDGAVFDADANVKDVRFQPIPGLMLN